LPDIAEPGASVRVLPLPANWIAALPPVMLPALKTLDPPPSCARIPVVCPLMLAPTLWSP
jgi:hypothetical protein